MILLAVGIFFKVQQNASAENLAESLSSAAYNELSRFGGGSYSSPERQAEFLAAQDRYREAATVERKAEERLAFTRSLWYPYAGLGLAAALFLILGSRLYLAELKRGYESRQALQEIERRARASAAEATGPGGDQLTLRAMWIENRTRIEGYHDLVISYAEATRRLTRTSLSVGFGFLLVVGLLAAFATSTSAAIATSVVAASGGALGAFVSNAVLRNAETSSVEVRAFFSHPLYLERHLAAERLLEGLAEPTLSEARLRLITSFAGPSDLEPRKTD